jgi:hypothetical protein
VTPRPVAGSFADDVYDGELGPLAFADPALGWPLLVLVGAIGQMFQRVQDLARDDADGNPGWSVILDIDRAPTEGLPWLGQFLGVRPTVGLTDAQQRAAIRGPAGFARGTPAAMVAAAQATLVGGKQVVLIERDASTADPPYNLTVQTYVTETPSSAKTLAALISQKPAGLKLNYSTIGGQTYQQTFTGHATYQQVFANHATYYGVLANTPA